MQSIFQIIQKVHEKMIRNEGYQRAWLEKHWEEIVGNIAREHSMTQKIKNKILYINVDSSAWNQNLFMIKRKLINKINGALRIEGIIDIKFQLGNDTDFMDKQEQNKSIANKEIISSEKGIVKTKMDQIILKKLIKAKMKGKG